MKAFINIRGCNGSGKTTLLRSLVKREAHAGEAGALLRSCPEFLDPTEQHPGAKPHKPIPFTFLPSGIAILGDYLPPAPGAQEATTAGCDRVKTQAATKAALEWAAKEPGVQFVLFEGVVVSTIFGPWDDWAMAQPVPMIWAFLDTPLSLCLERIQARNGGKPVKEDQVADKHATILRVRDKAKAAGREVADLPYQQALSTLRSLIQLWGQSE